MDNLKNDTTLKEFPKDIKFKYDWRKYQKKVLDNLEGHLDDNHLHIIAPPGSGKTVLGLEVALRLNKPTLVFAPTVAIKEQWIDRFCELFLQHVDRPEWISDDIRNPSFLTISTYQALHAACTNSEPEAESDLVEDESESKSNSSNSKVIDAREIIKLLKVQKIGTIVVDEAHHLKNEWWKSLTAINDELKPTIVGLTATPPYDVAYIEWQRYLELNGAIDFEISVPELVVENDLCPHQDYVYLSEPTTEENNIIIEQREKALKLFEDLKKDESLIHALRNHPVYLSPSTNLEWIYNNLECYSSLLIYLNATNNEITENHIEVVGDKKFKIPALTNEWMEILLNFYLFSDKENFNDEEHKEKLTNRLSRYGVLDRKTINFTQNQKINDSLGNSLSKLGSISKIIDVEYNSLGDNLRMVILTDYIRKEYLVAETKNSLELTKIGVMPIFEKLRRANYDNIRIGILSGSLIIIPKSAYATLLDKAQHGQKREISTTELPYDPNYLIVNTTEQIKHDLIHLITQIFEQGEIQILIGTKSLLGEGWDAPAINSLILASFVGSYVLSNQMRGRAIRSDRNNVNKTGNIWHLVCVDKTAGDGGADVQLLKRRFKGFVGLSISEDPSIENGISRLNLPDNYKTKNEITEFNTKTAEFAIQRDLLKQKWNEALSNGVSLTEVIKVPFPEDEDFHEIKSLYYHKTIRNLVATLGFVLMVFGQDIFFGIFRSLRYIKTLHDFLFFLMIVGIVGVIAFGGLFYKTLKLFIKYRDISKDIQQIGEALLESLVKMEVIKTNYSQLNVISTVDKFGAIYCHLEGGSSFEKATFIKSLHEIIGTINNPRYVIIRKNTFMGIVNQCDFHSVPELIAQNKKTAEYFEKQWSRFVGTCELVYTRTIEGRKILLKSRVNSLSSEFEDKTERINKWK